VVADVQRLVVAPGRRGKGLPGFAPEFEDGDVGHGVGADEFRLDFVLVGEGALDAGGLAGDMVVCDDVALGRDDDAAAAGLVLHLAAVVIVGPDDFDPHQGRLDRFDGQGDGFTQVFRRLGGDLRRRGAGDAERRQEDGEDCGASRKWVHVTSCRWPKAPNHAGPS
jgi:hypothetical protein